MLNILFLTHRLPFPPDRGDRIRAYQIIRHLAQRHRLSLAAVSDYPPPLTDVQALQALCASVDVVCVNRRRRQAVAACYLPTTVPLTLPQFSSGALKARIAHRLATEAFDLVFVSCSAMAPYVLSVDMPPKVVDFIDADSQKWLDYARSTSSPMKAVYWREGILLRRYERRVAERCAHAFVASEREAEIIRRIAPGVPVTTIPIGVSVASAARSAPDSRKLVFTGVMDYWPNVDAMVHFVRDVFPAIRARVPGSELVIVGQSPARAVRRLGRCAGVTVTGRVTDVTPYLEPAAVFVAPMRIARGVQTKILGAMAMGVPVVCTTPGLEGIGAVPGKDLLVGDTVDQFVAQTVSLLLDRERREAVRRSAVEFVRREHRPELGLDRLEAVLLEVAGSVDAAVPPR